MASMLNRHPSKPLPKSGNIPPARRKAISISLPPSLLDQMKKIAKTNRRSISNAIEIALVQYLKGDTPNGH